MRVEYGWRVDLRQLRHFLAVVEQGSILRAASVVHLTQPALSRSIQGLEDALGVKLLERGRRGIEPTPQGLLLARQARALVAQAEETRALVRGLRDAEAPRLALGVGTHLTGTFLPRVVARMLAQLPRLKASVRDGSGEDLVEALRRGEIDLALCAWPAAGVPTDLQFDEVMRSELAVFCRVSHPLARRRAVPLAELADRPWALAERPRAIAEVFRLTFTAAALPLPEPVARSTSLPFLLALLEESELISLLPAGYVETASGRGKLARIRAALPDATTRIGLLRRRRDKSPPPVVQSFLETLHGELHRPR